MVKQTSKAPGKEQLHELLDRTQQFHVAVAELTSVMVPIADTRFIVSFQSGILSLEHAFGAYLLLTQDLYGPGFSLHRPQFETLVRGVWLLHAATDTWVEKLSQPLTVKSAKKADQTPMLRDMLEQLGKSDAPAHLVQRTLLGTPSSSVR